MSIEAFFIIFNPVNRFGNFTIAVQMEEIRKQWPAEVHFAAIMETAVLLEA